MIKLSMSNLAWFNTPVEDVAPHLKRAGIDGVELSPTVIWSKAPNVSTLELRDYVRRWHNNGLVVSGIQSLLYGHPEMQVFDRKTWPSLRKHLTRMIRLASELGSKVAVFGSPKNRIRGHLTQNEADLVCAEFLFTMLPVLEDYGVTLTLEPNAPAYGADYLIRYTQAVKLSDMVDSPWVQPQVDTGCQSMVQDDPERAIDERLPAHIHISFPGLTPPPGTINHDALRESLIRNSYQGWVVLEMLKPKNDSRWNVFEAARWLTQNYAQFGRD
jgi:D-psicose/D-tagatose/L-ribulose 3-epimerase